MKNESRKKFKFKREKYIMRRKQKMKTCFLDNISNNEKNNFIKNVMEQENIKGKINSYNNLKKEIEILQSNISSRKEKIGDAINFENKVEEVKYLLKRYEEKLKELKFNIENNKAEEVPINKKKVKKTK